MSTVELRKEVINSLANVDERFLRMVRSLLKSYKEEEIDSFEDLPTEIQELIMQSREQVRQGNVRPHAEVMADFRKKYNVAG